MVIKEYEEKYAKEMSEIILSNLYTITIKDHGKEVVDRIARHFTEEEIKKNFPKRIKCFVAIDEGKVLATASLDKVNGMYGIQTKITQGWNLTKFQQAGALGLYMDQT